MVIVNVYYGSDAETMKMRNEYSGCGYTVLEYPERQHQAEDLINCVEKAYIDAKNKGRLCIFTMSDKVLDATNLLLTKRGPQNVKLWWNRKNNGRHEFYPEEKTFVRK